MTKAIELIKISSSFFLYKLKLKTYSFFYLLQGYVPFHGSGFYDKSSHDVFLIFGSPYSGKTGLLINVLENMDCILLSDDLLILDPASLQIKPVNNSLLFKKSSQGLLSTYKNLNTPHSDLKKKYVASRVLILDDISLDDVASYNEYLVTKIYNYKYLKFFGVLSFFRRFDLVINRLVSLPLSIANESS